jgi:hypothetical protein
MRLPFGMALLIVLSVALSSAQANVNRAKAQGPHGAVTGTVYCADTNAPARLAIVYLIPRAGEQSGQVALTETDLEGRLAIGHIMPGSYYVSVKFPGYLDPFQPPPGGSLEKLTEEQQKKLAASAVMVTVAGDQTATVSVRLDRAAAVEGAVLYDDGSPAIGLHIMIHPRNADTHVKPEDMGFANIMSIAGSLQQTTDDHGHFRLLGVSPGEYLVNTILSAIPRSAPDDGSFLATGINTMPVGAMKVYYGDTMRASDAKVVKVVSGETVAGTDITIPLSKLHTVSGTVLLPGGGQAESATVRMFYADTHEFARMAVARHGEFEMAYVPEGSYVLQAVADPQAAQRGTPENTGIVMTGGVNILLGAMIFGQTPEFTAGGQGATPLDVHGEVSGVTVTAQQEQVTKPSATPSPQAAQQ